MHISLLKAGAGVAVVRLTGMAVGFALTIVLARVLGPDGVGNYGYAVVLLALAAVPVNNGWAPVLLRATARAQQDRCGGWGEVAGLLQWGFWLTLALTILLTLGPGLLIFGPLGMGMLDLGALAILSGVLFFDQLSGLRLAVLRGLGHPVWGQVPEMLLRPLLILGFFTLLTGLHPEAPGLLGALLALVGASVLTALLGGVILWRKAPTVLRSTPSKTFLSAWTRSGAMLAGDAGLVLLNTQTDFLMLGLLGTSEDLGHYRVAMQVGLLGGFVYTALNMIAMQRFAHLYAREARDELQRSATFLARLAFFGSLPLPLIFWIWGDAILLNFFGPGFEAALIPILWLLGLQVLNACVGFSRTMLVMAGREGSLIPLTISSLLLNIALTLVLIPNFEVIGAAISSFCAVGLWNLLVWRTSLKLTNVDTSVFGLHLQTKCSAPESDGVD